MVMIESDRNRPLSKKIAVIFTFSLFQTDEKSFSPHRLRRQQLKGTFVLRGRKSRLSRPVYLSGRSGRSVGRATCVRVTFNDYLEL